MLNQSGKLVLLFCVIVVRAMPQGMTTTGDSDAIVQLAQPQRCSLPPVEPPNISCFASIPSWTFNSATGACESFLYGGCGRTTNLYETLAECNAICGAGPTGPVVSSSACSQPKIIGRCRASFPSFYFDMTTGVCTSFIYGGCDGNDNRFASEQACKLVCSEWRLDSQENE